MSFLRHREIYPSDGDPGIVVDVPSHRLDEFPVSYFSASCTPALLASASPTGSDYAVKLPCWSTVFQQPANSVLTCCLSPGGKRKRAPDTHSARYRDHLYGTPQLSRIQLAKNSSTHF